MEKIGNDPIGTGKIDNAAVSGLSGTPNSLAYKVNEIERHLHNVEKWFGAAAVPVAETHVADRMAGGIAPFILTAGADDFGAWVQILGTDDTPVTPGKASLDSSRLMVTDTNSVNPYIMQIVAGEFADIADKIAAEQYTETPYISASNSNDSGVEMVMVRRTPVGVKVWARCACIGSSGSTIALYFGIHEYEG